MARSCLVASLVAAVLVAAAVPVGAFYCGPQGRWSSVTGPDRFTSENGIGTSTAEALVTFDGCNFRGGSGADFTVDWSRLAPTVAARATMTNSAFTGPRAVVFNGAGSRPLGPPALIDIRLNTFLNTGVRISGFLPVGSTVKIYNNNVTLKGANGVSDYSALVPFAAFVALAALRAEGLRIAISQTQFSSVQSGTGAAAAAMVHMYSSSFSAGAQLLMTSNTVALLSTGPSVAVVEVVGSLGWYKYGFDASSFALLSNTISLQGTTLATGAVRVISVLYTLTLAESPLTLMWNTVSLQGARTAPDVRVLHLEQRGGAIMASGTKTAVAVLCNTLKVLGGALIEVVGAAAGGGKVAVTGGASVSVSGNTISATTGAGATSGLAVSALAVAGGDVQVSGNAVTKDLLGDEVPVASAARLAVVAVTGTIRGISTVEMTHNRVAQLGGLSAPALGLYAMVVDTTVRVYVENNDVSGVSGAGSALLALPTAATNGQVFACQNTFQGVPLVPAAYTAPIVAGPTAALLFPPTCAERLPPAMRMCNLPVQWNASGVAVAVAAQGAVSEGTSAHSASHPESAAGDAVLGVCGAALVAACVGLAAVVVRRRRGQQRAAQEVVMALAANDEAMISTAEGQS